LLSRTTLFFVPTFRNSFTVCDAQHLNPILQEQSTMVKILSVLASIFSPALITRILPHLFKAEATKQPGPEKKAIATQTIIVMINSNPEDFSIKEMNPSVPWPELIPILVDAVIRILNLLFGKNWLSYSNPPYQLEEDSPSPPG